MGSSRHPLALTPVLALNSSTPCATFNPDHSRRLRDASGMPYDALTQAAAACCQALHLAPTLTLALNPTLTGTLTVTLIPFVCGQMLTLT